MRDARSWLQPRSQILDSGLGGEPILRWIVEAGGQPTL